MKKASFLLTFLFSFYFFNDVFGQELGMQMGSMRTLMAQDVDMALQRLKDLGVKYIEGAGARGLSREEYKEKLDHYGIQAVVGGCNFDDLQSPEGLKKIIDNAKFFGMEYVVCYWIPHDGDNFVFADMEKGVKVFNEAGKQLADAGISFLYHPHGYEFRPYDGPGTMFDYMMTNTDPKYVNFEMDVFWIRNPGQDPAAIMRQYPGRFPVTHLKDRRIGAIDNLNGRQDKETNVTLGMGDVNIAEVIKAGKETGVKYHIIEDESSRAADQVTQSILYLRSLELDRLGVEGAVASLNRALVDPTEAVLKNLTCEELSYGHSSGLIEDRAAFINALVSGKSDFAKVDIADQEITVKGDVAWVRHHMNAELLSNGNTTPISLKILLIWKKEDGNWKLLARQAVR